MIELEHVSKIYRAGDTEIRALDDVSVTIADGEMVAIMGASGSGKSTMMNVLGCLDIPTRGRYRLDGVDVAELTDNELARIRNRKIGFVFQSFNLIPRTSASRNVELPLVYAGVSDRGAKARQALERVGLGDKAESLPNQLSGGQQQRVAIARALVTDPGLLLADEPTGNLDTATSIDIVNLLVDLNRAGHTVVIITHEEDIAAFAGRILRLRDGRIVSDTGASRTAETSAVEAAHTESTTRLTRLGSETPRRARAFSTGERLTAHALDHRHRHRRNRREGWGGARAPARAQARWPVHPGWPIRTSSPACRPG